jgi:hypothetical protein
VRRNILIILSVAALSYWIARAERAAGESGPLTDWIHTADGWESRSVLAARQAPLPAIHPGLIAAFELMASLLALAAFPGRATPIPNRRVARMPHLVVRERRRALAAS